MLHRTKYSVFGDGMNSISALDWSENGNIICYASSYDWGKGIYEYANTPRPKLLLHRVVRNDVYNAPEK